MKMTDKERTSMTEKNNFNYEPTIRTGTSEYSKVVLLRYMRESNFKISDSSVTVEHDYAIGKANYVVRSIFPLTEKPSASDKIKHLLSSAIDNNSLILRNSLDCETDKEYNDADENISLVTSQSV